MYRNFIIIFLAYLSAGCFGDTSARTRVEDALDEMAWATRSQAITGELLTMATFLSAEQSLDKSAVELGAKAQSELPCATPSVIDENVQFALPDLSSECKGHGKALSGNITVSVIVNDASSATVEFQWNSVTDGVVTVNGTSTATWNHGALVKTVTQNVDFSVNDNPELVFEMAETFTMQSLQDEIGVVLTGTRCWAIDENTDCMTPEGQDACLSDETDCWSLEFTELEVLWLEPIPQEGVHTFVNAKQERYTFAYEREHDQSITVTASDGQENYIFEITTSNGPEG